MLTQLIRALLCACGLHDYIWLPSRRWLCARCGKTARSN